MATAVVGRAGEEGDGCGNEKPMGKSGERYRLTWQIKTNYPLGGGLVAEETPCWLMSLKCSRVGATDFLGCQGLDLTLYF